MISDEKAHRNEFITLADIRRIEKGIEAEDIRLDRNDGVSTFRWAENLRSRGHLLGYKSTSCAVPSGSGLVTETFFLAVQTPWQRKMLEAHGRNLLCIDGTHNTTMYHNLTLTTLLVRDKWSHGEYAWFYVTI